jgi:hypothetical protein
MSWTARTDQGQIAPGTELAIFEDGWAPGVPERELTGGVALAIRFSNGAAARIDVIKVTATDAIIQTGQTQWRMVQVGAKELHSVPDVPSGAPATYWRVQGPVS